MGSHAFDDFAAELMLRGVSPRCAVNLAGYFQPNFVHPYDDALEWYYDVRIASAFPLEWNEILKSFSSPCDECIENSIENNYEIPLECEECQGGDEEDIKCDTCDINPMKDFKSKCSTCQYNTAYRARHFNTIEYIKQNRLARITKVYVDNSNMLCGSSGLAGFGDPKKTKGSKHLFSIENSKNPVKERKYWFNAWYIAAAIYNALSIGTDILIEMPTIFMASNSQSDDRAKWLNHLVDKFGFIHKNLPKKEFKSSRKKQNELEDQIIKDTIKQDLYDGNIDHFVICTGDGNSKGNGDTFLDVIEKIIDSKRHVTIFGFEESMHGGYKILAESSEFIDVIYAAKSSIISSMMFNANRFYDERGKKMLFDIIL